MKKAMFKRTVVLGLIVVSGLMTGRTVFAASETMKATKRDTFQDGNTESMRDVYMKREKDSKEYRQTVQNNGEETVKLLREIKALLQRIYELELEQGTGQ